MIRSPPPRRTQKAGGVHVFLTCTIPSAGPCVSFGRAATRPSQIPYDCSESTPALVPARCCWCGYAAGYIDEGGARRLAAEFEIIQDRAQFEDGSALPAGEARAPVMSARRSPGWVWARSRNS